MVNLRAAVKPLLKLIAVFSYVVGTAGCVTFFRCGKAACKLPGKLGYRRKVLYDGLLSSVLGYMSIAQRKSSPFKEYDNIKILKCK